MNTISEKLFESEYVRTYGRTYYECKTKALGLSFSFTGLKVTFEGTMLSGRFVSDVFDDADNCPYIAVYADRDVLSTDDLESTVMMKCQPDMILVSSLPKGRHTVMIRKLSEAHGHRLFLNELTTDGSFVANAPETERPLIEFYGDSLTAGLGMGGRLSDPVFHSKDQNVALGYAPLTCAALNADCSIVAISGFPMAMSPYTDFSKLKRVPELLNCAGYDPNHDPSELPQWNGRDPDLIVINLGANDRNHYNKYPEQKEVVHTEYVKRYNEFLDTLEKKYPNVRILMLSFHLYMRSGIDDWMKDIYAERDHSRLYLCSVSLRGMPSIGTGWHPTAKANKRYADVVIKFIKENIKLN